MRLAAARAGGRPRFGEWGSACQNERSHGGGGKNLLLTPALLALVAVAAIIAADFTAVAQAQSDEQSEGVMLENPGDEISGRIVARRLSTGRIEFGWQPSDSDERILPRARYFPRPAAADVDKWLSSSAVEVDGAAIGKINARLRAGGRIEFGFTPTDGERILPPSRYFPHNAEVGRWLRSTEIEIGAPSEPEPPADPIDPNDFIAVSAGWDHACALRASGAIECWGRNENGQTDAPAGSYSVVAAGVWHSCAIRESDGAIECWGYNEYGQTDAPQGNFSAVTAGNAYTCAMRAGSGTIVCWGWNDNGRTDAPTGRFTAISSVRSAHTCAIRESDSQIECWGWNNDGQTDAPAGKFVTISAGWIHTCAIRASGALVCWGSNDNGRTDAPVATRTRSTAVSASYDHSCAIRESDGAIECWGLNRDGAAAPPGGKFRAVSAGRVHTCAIRDDRTIECWGDNEYGQLDAPTE